ncbi:MULTISPECIES: 4Fe-4S dicluster domain-containing protein [unclassified Proteiniphilum]|jgi:quinone-modifying oxidoreductase subunit QmoC|uniref:4Fe-4S dicluster domain-containing protein n=1 Tax=unclassified Proteiniphilum TaxID=2622718 RepID=UPI00257F78D9|nr:MULTISPECIES: 4Fe-4S dicluster domain-containing protein [unclassified Proteiniphilum]MDD4778485.1 4Fe-4S dicluster domain-containing protein [Fermentimonas sp.]
MATKINPKFKDELKKYGAVNMSACYNCGTCTAVCSLSSTEESFPREMIRLSALGIENEIKSSLKPWECYYCGECTNSCPQTANPGELMMSLRRWLTSKYDWTGLSSLLYRSFPATIAALILVLAGTLFFACSRDFNLEEMLHYGHRFEIIAISTVFLVIFVPNLLRMWYFTIVKPKVRTPLKRYFSTSGELFVHMFTQKRYKDCEENTHFRWFEHMILVFAYLSLLFTTVFLNWFATYNLFFIILGYVESLLIFAITFDFVGSRIKKSRTLNKFSQPSDWLFVTWLLLMGITAFLVRLFIDLNLTESVRWVYLIHLIVLAQWALIIVPFGKWTHFLYRSFAMYFSQLKTQSKEPVSESAQ